MVFNIFDDDYISDSSDGSEGDSDSKGLRQWVIVKAMMTHFWTVSWFVLIDDRLAQLGCKIKPISKHRYGLYTQGIVNK